MPPALGAGGILSPPRAEHASAVLRGVVEGLGEDSATVQGVVNDLANRRHVRVYVHADAGPEVTNDPLGRDFEGRAHELREATRLNVVNHLQPLCQRVRLCNNHFSSAPYFSRPPGIFCSEGPVLVTI